MAVKNPAVKFLEDYIIASGETKKALKELTETTSWMPRKTNNKKSLTAKT